MGCATLMVVTSVNFGYFQDQLKDSIHGSETRMICFDYHQNCRGGKLDKMSVLKDKARPSLNEFGLFFAKGDQIVK